jgi:hypothetical protein
LVRAQHCLARHIAHHHTADRCHLECV